LRESGWTEARRRKQSQQSRAMWADPVMRKKIVQGLRRAWTKVRKERYSQIRRGHKTPERTREKISASMVRYWDKIKGRAQGGL